MSQYNNSGPPVPGQYQPYQPNYGPPAAGPPQGPYNPGQVPPPGKPAVGPYGAAGPLSGRPLPPGTAANGPASVPQYGHVNNVGGPPPPSNSMGPPPGHGAPPGGLMKDAPPRYVLDTSKVKKINISCPKVQHVF